MAGGAGADLLIGDIRYMAAGIAGFGV